MMKRPIAAIDTDVLILLLDNSRNPKPELAQRKGYAELTVERLNRVGVRWVVPAPAVAELFRGGPGSLQIREVARIALRGLRVEVLDMDAADIAGRIMQVALAAASRTSPRGVVKYDALIAAVAHRIDAKWLVTGNGRDMRAHLSVVDSPVEVVVATEPPARGQTVLFDVLKPGLKSET